MVAAPDYHNLIKELENEELTTTVGVLSCHVYSKLLALYVQQNDLCNAKFLWKRIPEALKQSNPELQQIWNVGIKLWKRDFTGVYSALNVEWSPEISPIMETLLYEVHAKVIKVVSLSYSSIELEDFARLLNCTAEEAVKIAQDQKWDVLDSLAAKTICPTRPTYTFTTSTSNEDQLSKLTEFVSFLEN